MRLFRVAIVPLLLVLGLAPLTARASQAATRRPRTNAGGLDLSFGGGDGFVTTSVTSSDYIEDVALQSDGKIVAAGYAGTPLIDDFAVARYTPDGVLDTTFSGDGIVTTPIAGDDLGQGVAVQSDGKIVVVGEAKSTNYDFAVVRYNTDGTLDTGFGGGDGIVVTPIFSGDDYAYDVALQSDGKIVAAGYTASGTSHDFAVVRYNTDGSLDATFDTDGIASTDFDGKEDTAYGIQIQSDGKIVAGGLAKVAGDSRFGVVRYNTNGALDSSFDGDGRASASIAASTDDRIYDVAIDADGRIVGAGYVDGSLNKDYALVRFSADGTLDTSFDTDGFVRTDMAGRDQIAYAVGIQPDGKIIATGFAQQPTASDDDFMVARYNGDGSLDGTFGAGGIVTTSIGLSDFAYGSVLQPDGKIVAGGYSAGDFAVARYLGAGDVGSGVPSDFNGDGFGDLAVGVPGEDVGATIDTGAVNVIYGSATGLSATSNQFWDEQATGVSFDASGDAFGWAVAEGDFNGDGFADLAVGVPGRQVGSVLGAGMVLVLYGSPAGLASTGAQAWTQDSTDILDAAEQDDNFGYAVAAGDFNGDGFDDLVSGVPGEDVGTVVDAGAVNVIYGSASGLTATGNQFWNENSTDILGTSEASDIYGFAVTTGDLNGNGFADLGIGIPGENVGTIADAGSSAIIYGSASGLTSTGNQVWNENSTNILGSSEKGDSFGFAVIAGDFNGNGFVDFAAGVPFENVGTIVDAGSTTIIYGSASGLTSTGNQVWNENSTNILGSSEKGDWFGFALAAGDFNGNGFVDFAAGVAAENVGTIVDGGSSTVIYGSASGLTSSGNQVWNQNSTGINDASETADYLGYAMTAGDFGNGSQADLVLGVTFETVGTVTAAGAVNVVYGSATGLSSTNNQFWNQDSTDILDAAEAYDEFGFGLSFSPGSGPASRAPRRP